MFRKLAAFVTRNHSLFVLALVLVALEPVCPLNC